MLRVPFQITSTLALKLDLQRSSHEISICPARGLFAAEPGHDRFAMQSPSIATDCPVVLVSIDYDIGSLSRFRNPFKHEQNFHHNHAVVFAFESTCG